MLFVTKLKLFLSPNVHRIGKLMMLRKIILPLKSIESNSNFEMLLVVEAFRELLSLIVRDRSSTSVSALAERKLLWLLELGNRLRHSTAP